MMMVTSGSCTGGAVACVDVCFCCCSDCFWQLLVVVGDIEVMVEVY